MQRLLFHSKEAHMTTNGRHIAGFTKIELLFVISIIALLIGILIPAFGTARRTSSGQKNSSPLRGMHQSAVIYAQNNGGFLPGLDPSGHILADGPATGFSGPGSTPMARFWILLDAEFIPAEMLANPQETLSAKWTTGSVTREHYSYAMLRIDSEATDAERLGKWKDNANARALLISDRNTGPGVADSQVMSLWTTTNGDWKGNIVRGDNSAEFAISHRAAETKYGQANKDDHIFVDEPDASGNNAMMVR